MMIRRLVGIDLGITSAHTVRVLDETGETHRETQGVADGGEPARAVETAALAGTPPGTRLEVVMEPTGPAWLPIAVFFSEPRPCRVSGVVGEGIGSAQVLVTAHQDQRHRCRHAGPVAVVRPGRAAATGAARRRARQRWIDGCGPVTGSPGRDASTRSGSRTWSASCSR